MNTPMTTPITRDSGVSLTSKPRFGGVLWRGARATGPLLLWAAGKRWNPVFSVVEHTGRKSGRTYATPVAARRIADGFILSLAFGAQVDWYRNLVAAGGGTIRWRGRAYSVGAPVLIERVDGLAAFHPVQRAGLRLGRIDGFIRVPDVGSDSDR